MEALGRGGTSSEREQEPQASERPVQPCSINKVLEESLWSWEERKASERPVEVHEVDGINKVLDNGGPTSREERQANEKPVQLCSINDVLEEESLWSWEVLDNGDPASWEERQASEGRMQGGGINKVPDDGGLWLWEERQAYERRVEEHKGCERREVHETCERQVEMQQGSRAREVAVCSACGRA
ncbi:hypothetical protein M405DRAFT_863333 [Rhizopogon salebrosus TDB-379]|nr:hypothetical protein M405DRAFT_863333 [Rhizopogon salebrosus TDB-379]